MKLPCRYLEGEFFGRCLVDKERYIPRIFEVGEYRKEICANDKHVICPWYRKHSGQKAGAEALMLEASLEAPGR